MKKFLLWLAIILILMFIISLFSSRHKDENKKNNSVVNQEHSNIDEVNNDNINNDHDSNDDVIKETYISYSKIPDLELPDDNDILRYKAFTLSYNEEYEQAEWVAYILTCFETQGKIKRTNRFKEDKRIITGSAKNEDYRKSGYDRGHLIPAADNSWDKIAMEESFLYSNMSPQDPSFNRGIWKELEEQVRDWTCNYDSLYIVTGPIFKGNMKRIGPNRVAVPPYYYKALLYYSQNKTEAIAFILPNEKSNKEIYQYVVTIDSLEKEIGFDLFYKLNDDFENTIESRYNLNFWFRNLN